MVIDLHEKSHGLHRLRFGLEGACGCLVLHCFGNLDFCCQILLHFDARVKSVFIDSILTLKIDMQ